MTGRLVWENPEWLWPAGVLAAIGALLAVGAYSRAQADGGARLTALLCRLAALLAIVLFLGNPQWETTRPVPGANEFWMLADNSASLGLRSTGGDSSRGEEWLKTLAADPAWLTGLERDFQLRRFTFDDKLRPQKDLVGMTFDGQSSSLYGALQQLAGRVRHRPCAGMVLFTDGNATDELLDAAALRDLPPIYCVVPPVPRNLIDLSVGQVQVAQSNFESAPVTIQANLQTLGDWNKPVVVQLLDQQGKMLEQQTVNATPSALQKPVRFRFRPEETGVQGYRLRAFAEGDQPDFEQKRTDVEVTLENNERWCVVDRGGGPYRVLYVSGRANWEYKFLRRALSADEEMQLVGLIRVARREPRFAFRSRGGESSNPLYRGFEGEEEETERYDQPVLVRLETRDNSELSDGFPKQREELFGYHALVLDDVEADFFTTDQHQAVRDFVTQRGGALLMLGGPDTFREGKYQDTPIGTIVPVYLDRATDERPGASVVAPQDDLKFGNEGDDADSDSSATVPYRFDLTREGWLEPWLRLHDSVDVERRRIEKSPQLYDPSIVGDVRPGASPLAELTSADGGQKVPMLVAQRYGAGKTVALTTADLWRWQLQGEQLEGAEEGETSLNQFWRQMARWLVSDVTPRITADTRTVDGRLHIELKAVDREYEPSGDAEVELSVLGPDGKQFQLSAQPSSNVLGLYEIDFSPSLDGFYRATVTARFAGEETPVVTQLGWTWSPRRNELEALTVNRPALDQLAQLTGGAVLELDELSARLQNLPVTGREVVEPERTSLWHRWWWITLTLAALAGEWTLRRWNGLA